jgi:predicted nucleic acid-binding protein
MNSYLFDTCFLIDLEREKSRVPAKAHHFLGRHAKARAHVSWTVAGEFAEGFGDIHHPVCAAMLSRFEILPMNESTAHHYAVTARLLRTQNQLIGANDLWIAASAMANKMALVTNNIAHFGRIPALSVVSY